jgi:hypothetical protein
MFKALTNMYPGGFMANLDQKVNEYTDEFQKLWYELPSTIAKSLPYFDNDSKDRNERYIETFINNLYQSFLSFPDSEEERRTWGKNIYKLVTDFGCKSEFVNNKAISHLFSKNIKGITKEFITRAKSFDDKMTFQDIGQAMRNVWIMNISQVLLDIDVKFTDSIFAYSMLYPYTDNILDDNSLTSEYKKNINYKLKNIIKGNNVELKSDYENRLFDLIEMINKEFERRKHQNLFESILAIHEAQETSLNQQSKALSPYEKDMLNISLKKGGTSVLADGYLVKGELTNTEIKFMLGYGIMLQLCDDLQDVQEDIQNNNTTIFSLTAKHWELDNITNKLINFIDHVIYVELKDFHYDIKEDMDTFLKENCLMLAFLSMGNSRRYFSQSYLADIEKYMPFRFSFLKYIREDFRKKYKKIKKRYGDEGLNEMINYI